MAKGDLINAETYIYKHSVDVIYTHCMYTQYIYIYSICIYVLIVYTSQCLTEVMKRTLKQDVVGTAFALEHG